MVKKAGVAKVVVLLVFNGGPIQDKALKALLNLSVHGIIPFNH